MGRKKGSGNKPVVRKVTEAEWTTELPTEMKTENIEEMIVVLPERKEKNGVKSCPICGSNNIIQQVLDTPIRISRKCRNCGFAGPIGMTSEQALLLWNEL